MSLLAWIALLLLGWGALLGWLVSPWLSLVCLLVIAVGAYMSERIDDRRIP